MLILGVSPSLCVDFIVVILEKNVLLFPRLFIYRMVWIAFSFLYVLLPFGDQWSCNVMLLNAAFVIY